MYKQSSSVDEIKQNNVNYITCVIGKHLMLDTYAVNAKSPNKYT